MEKQSKATKNQPQSQPQVRTLFTCALNEAIRSHGDTSKSLLAKVKTEEGFHQLRTLAEWRTGRSAPRHRTSRVLLGKIERQYGLPGGYFSKLITQSSPSFKGVRRELNAFQFSLNSLMGQFGDSSESLADKISQVGCRVGARALTYWKTGGGVPRNSSNNITILRRIERHYELEEGFLSDLIKSHDTPTRAALRGVPVSLVRFAMQLGFRQKNLRELMFRTPDAPARSLSELEDLRRGELRWNNMRSAWEVFIPAKAFKNGASSYFKGRPYRLFLSDFEGLYDHINSYLDRHRGVLLNGNPDPGTLFIRSAHSSRRARIYDMFGFYQVWRTIIQRYGIYNPYTGQGAISGLLPHGPHAVRDIIATHILKQTGSYELAGFAIQDTAKVVERHYGRYFPHEKAERAADILNSIWQGTQLRKKSVVATWGF